MKSNSFSLLSFAQIAYLKDFNEDQKKAIETAYAMVKHSPSVAKVCLIHGPPGTGKSKTIVGLLYRLLTEVEYVRVLVPLADHVVALI